MNIALTALHILACSVLVLVVLLQQGKGADMGAVFGGSSSTVFGSSGAGSFLTRLTTAAAAIFMLTSLTLTYVASHRLSSSIFDTSLPQPPPIAAPPAQNEPSAAQPATGAAASNPANVAPGKAPAAQAPPAAAAGKAAGSETGAQAPQAAVPGAGSPPQRDEAAAASKQDKVPAP